MDRKLILLLTLLLVSGVALTLAAFFFGIFSFDLEVALRLREFGHPVFIAVLGVVSSPGDGGVPAILVAMTAAICAFKKKWPEAVFVVATLSAVLLAGVLKVLIGPSRIFLGKHWVSDVIGSYIIGYFWLIILILLYQTVLHWQSRGLEVKPVKVPDEPGCRKLPDGTGGGKHD